MPKDLFVRDFGSKLHSRASQIAKIDGVTLGSIVNDAVDQWVRQREKTRHRLDLILYSDEKSMLNILNELDHLTNQNWFRAYFGPSSNHKGTELLKKYKWFNGTVTPYDEFYDNPIGYVKKVLKKVGNEVNTDQLLTLVFLTRDMTKPRTVKIASKFCEWFKAKKVPGITQCLVDTDNVFSGKTEDIIEFFNCHDQVFIVKDDKLHRLRLTDESFFSLVV